MPAQPTQNPNQRLIALVGNPNSGKTSIFNHLTGSNQHVGNWGGVTVERRDGWFTYRGQTYRVTDLPGMYSLAADTPDEAIARDFIIYGCEGEPRPDLVVQVIDGGSLERSLLLTMQLLDQDLPLVIALNMFDEVRRRGLRMDPAQLARRLGVPVVPTVGNRGEGIKELMEAIHRRLAEDSAGSAFKVKFESRTEAALNAIQTMLAEAGKPMSRGMAIGMLTGEPSAFRRVPSELEARIREVATSSKPAIGSDWSETVTHHRYAAISRLLAGVVGRVAADRVSDTTSRLDAVLIHPIWGVPIFILIFLALFQLTFKLGSYPMGWIDALFVWMADLVHRSLPAGWLTDLFADGVISGIGFIAVFLPNILILLVGIHLLEDSGYMARAAFLMDRLMRLMGLHGKAFIPMLMGFGCNVPALLGTRTLASPRDRILTMLLIPLMSCSARLPVYVMVTTAVFPHYGGLVIFGLYLLGVATAIGVGRLFARTVLRGPGMPFIMEMPPYRWPTLRTTVTVITTTLRLYLRHIAVVVAVFAVVIWVLSNFPRAKVHPGTAAAEMSYGEHTIIGRMGRWVEPVFKPLGFTVPMDIALLSGFVAKEVVVAAMGVIYTGGSDARPESLVQALRQDFPSPAVALAFLVFVLLYTPCLTTIVTLHREARRWKWTALSLSYQTFAAWTAALVVRHVATWMGLG